jgi:hypothetical protein
MAAIGSAVPTLVDVAKRLDPDGRIAVVAELLSQTNAILEDMPWLEGNLPTGHRTTVRTGLPTVAWRLLNQGVTPSKSRTAQIDEACGMLEAWCEVDKKIAELNGNVAAYRMSEAKAFIEAMNQEFASTLFYGTNAAPEEFVGLSARYSSSSAANGQNIVLSPNSTDTDMSSFWLIGWGENTIHGIYPKGSKAGLEHRDLGLQVVEASAGMGGTRLEAYRDKFAWDCGIALRDWRYVVRGANVDISALVAKSSAADLYDMMIKATHRIPNLGMCRPVFYMNRTLFQMLDIQGRDDVVSGGQLSYENVAGKRIASFRGIPVKIVDALTQTETFIS